MYKFLIKIDNCLIFLKWNSFFIKIILFYYFLLFISKTSTILRFFIELKKKNVNLLNFKQNYNLYNAFY